MVWFARSMPPVGVTVSNWALFVHDFGWDVRACFAFDVDDARFLVALQYHFLMTCDNTLCASALSA